VFDLTPDATTEAVEASSQPFEAGALHTTVCAHRTVEFTVCRGIVDAPGNYQIMIPGKD